MEQKKYERNQIRDFTSELDRQTTSRMDRVVYTNTNQVRMETDGFRLWLSLPIDGTIRKLSLTEYAQKQIASYYKVHSKYFQKMKSRGALKLLCDNINEWIPTADTEKNKRLFRILDNEIIAFLGPNYFCIDNKRFIKVAFDHLSKISSQMGIQWELRRMDITESHLYVKITSPQLTDEVTRGMSDGRKVGDVVEGGIIIRNSEVGDGAFIVEPFINVLRCTNGMVRTVAGEVYKRTHRGKEQKVGQYETVEKSIQKTIEKLENRISTFFTPETFHNWVNQINEKSQIELPNPSLAVHNLIEHFNLSDSMKAVIEKQLEEENSPTVWGLVMAVTRIAQNEKDYEKQIQMERIGSDILTMNPKILMKEIEVEE